MWKGIFYGFRNAAGAAKQPLVNADDRQEVYSKGAKTTAILSADAVILATGGAYIDSVNVTVAGSAVGGLHNCATVLAADATNLIAVVPNTAGNTPVRSVFSVGCVYKVGTGQKIAYNGIIS